MSSRSILAAWQARRLAAVLCASMAWTGCGDSGGGGSATDAANDNGGPDLTGPTTTLIDGSGGTATSADGRLTLVFPPGALSAPTEIGIEPLSGGGSVTFGDIEVPRDGYSLSPSGLQLDVPAQVRWTLPDELAELDTDLPLIGVALLSDDGSLELLSEQTLEWEVGATPTTSGQLSHFSDVTFFDAPVRHSHRMVPDNDRVLECGTFANLPPCRFQFVGQDFTHFHIVTLLRSERTVSGFETVRVEPVDFLSVDATPRVTRLRQLTPSGATFDNVSVPIGGRVELDTDASCGQVGTGLVHWDLQFRFSATVTNVRTEVGELHEITRRDTYTTPIDCLPSACCHSDGRCTEVTPTVCADEGGVFEVGRACDEVTCADRVACCTAGNNCQEVTTEAACADAGGVPSGVASCGTAAQRQLCATSSCCDRENGTCSMTTEDECESPNDFHAGVTCNDPDFACDLLHGCCLGQGACEMLPADVCEDRGGEAHVDELCDISLCPADISSFIGRWELARDGIVAEDWIFMPDGGWTQGRDTFGAGGSFNVRSGVRVTAGTWTSEPVGDGTFAINATGCGLPTSVRLTAPGTGFLGSDLTFVGEARHSFAGIYDPDEDELTGTFTRFSSPGDGQPYTSEAIELVSTRRIPHSTTLCRTAGGDPDGGALGCTFWAFGGPVFISGDLGGRLRGYDASLPAACSLCDPNCTLGCCTGDSCSVVSSNDACTGGSVRGPVFECAGNTCTTSSGACCLEGGGCDNRNVLACTAATTTFEPDVACTDEPDPCGG